MSSVSKTFQELITFSRSTSGTYVNSAGYITTTPVTNYLAYSSQFDNAAWTKSSSFVQQNLLTYSEDFANINWGKNFTGIGVVPVVTANQGIAPDGTLTADRVDFDCGSIASSANRSYINQAYSSAAVGVTYASSTYIKAFDSASIGKTIRFTNESGTTQQVIVTLTDTWQRVPNTFAAGATSYTLVIETRGTFTSSATASVLLWGAQLVRGSVPGDYRATTTAALPVLYPDYTGALLARKLCEAATTGTHYISQSTTSPNGTYTLSVICKPGERGHVYLDMSDNTTGDASVQINILAGTYSSNAVTGSWSNPSASVISLGNGWYRCSLTGTRNAGTQTVGFVYVSSSGGPSYTGDGSSGIYVADAQLEPGTSVGPYYDTSTTLTYAPRLDYDPVTLLPRGLLVEESRTNLLFQSNDFQTSWTQVNITRTLNSILSPSGNVDGVKIAATASVATTEVQGATVAATSATGSVYVKQGTGPTTANLFALRNQTTLTDLIVGTLNYSTGVFTYTTGSTGVVVTNAGNGWWRIALSATTGITSGDTMRLYVGFTGAAQTAGNFLYVYGAQLEAGAFATSYIPTAGSQLTRAADVASVNLFSQWYNSSAWTLYLEYVTKALAPVGGNTRVIELNNGTVSTRALFYSTPPATGDGLAFQVRDAGVDQTAPSFAGVNVVGAILKQAAAAKANDFAFTVNGVSPSVDVLGTLPTFSQFNIASVLSGGAPEVLNGWLRRITFYPQRLTNAQLQSITA